MADGNPTIITLNINGLKTLLKKAMLTWAPVSHICNPTWEAEIRRVKV
jgi:hypothetical protein